MLSVRELGYETDGQEVFRNITLSVNKGDKIGLVGRNGIGKTTLLRLMAGQLQPTDGEVNSGDCEVGLLPQDLKDWLDKSVYEFLEATTGVANARQEFEHACERLETNHDEATLLLYSDSLDKFNRYEVANFENNLEHALALAEINQVNIHETLGNLSGGQRTRVALAAIFASRYDVVLLDEPTNNLDTRGIVVLERFIGNSNAAFVMVSHDRRFLRNATTRIIEILGGDQGLVQYGLGYDEYIESRESAREAAFRRYEQYETEKKRLSRAAKDANIRAAEAGSSRSRAVDNDKLTANFRSEKAAFGLARAAQGLATRSEHLEEPPKPEEDVSLAFVFSEVDKKKYSLLAVNDLEVEYPNGLKIGPLSLHLQSGDRISITGINGIGKSSLLRAILGKSTGYVRGTVNFGKEAKPFYIDQDQSLPLEDGTAFDNIKHLAPHLQIHEIINLLLRFNLKKDIIKTTKARDMSGGERAKVILAAVAANQANLLILDEPTNNLDIPTVEALETALKDYRGGIIVVSHDRDFLSHLDVTHEIRL
jgi:ATPase subunit of ABC transporter with duplicated ATPase domains